MRSLPASLCLQLRLLPVLLVAVVWLPIQTYLRYEKDLCDIASGCQKRVAIEWKSMQPSVPPCQRTFLQVVEDSVNLARYEGNDKCLHPKTREVYYRGFGKEVMGEIARVNEAYSFFRDLESLSNEEKDSFRPEIRRYSNYLERRFDEYPTDRTP